MSRTAAALAVSCAIPRRTARTSASVLVSQLKDIHPSHGLPFQTTRAFASRSQFQGFPFGGGAQPQSDDRFYKLLDVEKTATEAQIKQAYKKQAMQHHPDRGGDEATFKDISRAYEVLSNPEKRQLYDMYGEQGLEGAEQGGAGAPSGVDPFDLFSQMFGFQAAGGSRQGRQGRPRTADSSYELYLTLEDLYAGTSRRIKFQRDVLCKPCNGQGGSERSTCKRCNGTGVVVTVQAMGPFMRQSQEPCQVCTGRGYTISSQHLCGTCKGKCTVKEPKVFDIEIEPGQEDGTQIRFRGEADQAPGHDAGDVVVVVREKSHKTFQRVKDSLIMSKKLSLAEALCGFQFSTKFLDGEDLIIRSEPGQVVRPGDIMTVRGKGMPHGHSKPPGDLFIQLQVEFPSEIPKESRGPLAGLLGGKLPDEENLIEANTAQKLSSQQADRTRRSWSEQSQRNQQQQAECVQQ